jgi:phenylpyruvate tautomerase PptA (4-oxalocrotonate tautomerase family)
MPLMRIDVVEGRSKEQLRLLCDCIHRAMVEAFHVPVTDRYQIVQQHSADTLLVEDTGLGYPRTSHLVVISMVSRPRSAEAKVKFYELACAHLGSECGVPPTDVVINVCTNQDEDWSFGRGRAQFLTGEL